VSPAMPRISRNVTKDPQWPGNAKPPLWMESGPSVSPGPAEQQSENRDEQSQLGGNDRPEPAGMFLPELEQEPDPDPVDG
jgi:hypothetical protein